MRFHTARRIGFATIAPTGPPIHHGNCSRSFHVNFVRPPRRRVSVKRPEPFTTPSCAMPIVWRGDHSVIVITSRVRNGPTFVVHTNVVSTPRVRCVRNSIDSASAIHST